MLPGQAPHLVSGCGACIFTNTFWDVLTRPEGALMFEGLFQPMHLLVVFGIALLVFGPKKLPELGKGIGEGIRGFKSAIKAEEEKPANTTTTVVNKQGRAKE
jgi:sec-independent protein translocase protein TatA